MNQEREPLTVLSFGGGQDSTAILLMCLHNKYFRDLYAPGKLLVVMADTGDEHLETYRHVEEVQRLCALHEVEFVLVQPTMGFHPRTWPSLRAQMERNNTIMSKAFRKSCTDNLKIKPIYNYVEHWLKEEYGYTGTRRKALYSYAREFGPLRVLIGIAKGEESRVSGPLSGPLWMQRCISRVYPLIQLGMDRQACQEEIALFDFPVPPPSNCILCPWMSEIELLWLHRFQPHDFAYWVKREQAKMARPLKAGLRNLGVWGNYTLEQVLARAQEKYGDWTDARLQEYKMSHGHCVKSKH